MLADRMPSVLIVNPYASAVNEERIAAVQRTLGGPEVVRTERAGHATEQSERIASVRIGSVVLAFERAHALQSLDADRLGGSEIAAGNGDPRKSRLDQREVARDPRCLRQGAERGT